VPTDTPTTTDFETLLTKRNVIAVNYDPDADRLDTWVSQKLTPDQLDPQDNVADPDNLPKWFTGDVDVHDAGMGDERDGFDPAIAPGHQAATHMTADPENAPDRRTRTRPVESGVSEINANSTAATGGVLARVTATDSDTATGPDEATWGDHVDVGDLVRISNTHVYSDTINETPVDGSATVLQPSPFDGGDAADAVGVLAGYAPLKDGGTVDAAARSVSIASESWRHYDALAPTHGGVRRDDYQAIIGRDVLKGGRTTGETKAAIRAHDASVNIRYGDPVGTVTLRHQLVAGDMSRGGDSGSPVFLSDGALVGHLFAGSSNTTIINRAAAIEQTLGVELMPDEIESLTTDVSVTMESPSLSLVRADPLSTPAGGETVTIRVTLESNYAEDVYLSAVGPAQSPAERDIPASAFELRDGGEAYRAMTEVDVVAPEGYVEEFRVALEGGYVFE
jgi:hypothetical protein